MRSRTIQAVMALFLAFAGSATAQQALAQGAANPRQRVVMPNGRSIVLLVRTTLVTLGNAIKTGNFTVLRDMGAPGFRKANTAADLARSFSDLAARGIDLSVVSVIAPKLSERPKLDRQRRMLRLEGYFPTRSKRIEFEILFQAVDGHWRLFGLSVNPGRAAPAEGAAKQSRSPQGAAPPAQEGQARPASEAAPQPAAQESPSAFVTDVRPAPPSPSRKPQ